MKSLDAKKGEKKADNREQAAQTETGTPVAEVESGAPLMTVLPDLSKVKIEPLFEEMVDFETFAKSDFRVV